MKCNSYEKPSGFSLMELLAVIVIVIIMLGILVGVKPFAQNPLTQASDQVVAFLELARTEAVTTNQKVLLVVSKEAEDEQRAIGLARYNEEMSSIELTQKFLRLPKDIIIELEFSNEEFPNLFSLSARGGYTLAREGVNRFNKSLVYATLDRHGAVTGQTRDASGTVVEAQFIGGAERQKGCYVILREGKFISGTPLEKMTRGDLKGCSLIYISPLTGKVSQVSSI